MKLWQEALVPLLCLSLLGCRTDPSIALIERDNRELENTIYELQACIEKYQRNLDSCQRQNAALQAKLNDSKNGESRGTPETSAPAESQAPAPRKSTPAPPVSPQELQPPMIELPPESNSTNQMPSKKSGSHTPQRGPASQPALSMPELEPASPAATKTSAAGRAAQRRRLQNTQVAGIQVDERFTGAMDREGVSVAIEPRDSLGRPCLAAAPISVVVLDPALPGEAARIARWDFSAQDIAALLQQTPPGEGIRLAMPWPQQPPAHKQLHLYVRYTTDNGQKLQADCPLELESSAQQAKAPALLPVPAAQAAEEPPATPLKPAAEGNASETDRSLASSSAPTSRSEATASRPSWSPQRR